MAKIYKKSYRTYVYITSIVVLSGLVVVMLGTTPTRVECQNGIGEAATQMFNACYDATRNPDRCYREILERALESKVCVLK